MTTPREYPWWERQLHSEHLRRFENLVEIHALTHAWTQGILQQPPGEALSRYLPEAELKFIHPLDEAVNWQSSLPHLLEDLVGATTPDALLDDWEIQVHSAQINALHLLSENVADSDISFRQQLESLSESCGLQFGQKKWPILPSGFRSELAAIFFLFSQTACAHFPKNDGILLRRMSQHHLSFEWNRCPHVQHSADPQRDLLCHLYSTYHWSLVRALNPSITRESQGAIDRGCQINWRIPEL